MKVLYLLFVLDSLNLAVFLPVFSAFVRSLGGTPFTLGLINSSSALITLLWNLIVGSLSDQVGRKGLLFKCMLASSLGSLILCASSSSLIIVLIGRLVGALGSPVAILLRSTVADTFKTDEEKKHFFNKSAPIISLAFLLGSLSSGFLSEAKNGYILAFFAMAVIMALGSFITHSSLPDDSKLKQTKNNTSFAKKAAKELKTAVTNITTISWPRYQQLFIMKCLYDLSLCIIFSNIGLILVNEFNVAGRHIGYVFFMTTVFSIVSNILKLKLKETFDSIPDNLKILQGGLALLISYIGMGLSTSVTMFLVFVAIMCFTRTFMEGFWTEMVTLKSLENDRGKVFAAFENVFPLMSFVTPVLSGLVAEAYGERLLVSSAALPISIAVLIAYRKLKQD